MTARTTMTIVGLSLAAIALGATAGVSRGQSGHDHGAKSDTAGTKKASPSRAISMEELHRAGGVPRGWKFTLPTGGDPGRGRQLFTDLECYKCHAIAGGGFPPSGGEGKTGPELTGMGGHHPAEYFAESIIAPNHVLLAGPGWIGPDGRSIMPSYADSLSVMQLLDLVAFIKSQDSGHAHHDDGVEQERAVGPYRVRLVFKLAGRAAESHHHGDVKQSTTGGHDHGAAHGGHAHHGASTAGAAGHLIAFITDAATGDAVPYLPVSVGIHARGAPARTLKLAPMLGRDGFHYGADTTLPSSTRKVVLSIGATTLHVMGPDRGRFTRAHTVSFEWSPRAK
jgi:mono/diheme cytochrome c family protein